MTNDEHSDLQKKLDNERERVKLLAKERDELLVKVQTLENDKSNYKPLADAWLRENMPSREECERLMTEILAHPEDLLDFNEVVPKLLEELDRPESGEHAA